MNTGHGNRPLRTAGQSVRVSPVMSIDPKKLADNLARIHDRMAAAAAFDAQSDRETRIQIR